MPPASSFKKYLAEIHAAHDTLSAFAVSRPQDGNLESRETDVRDALQTMAWRLRRVREEVLDVSSSMTVDEMNKLRVSSKLLHADVFAACRETASWLETSLSVRPVQPEHVAGIKALSGLDETVALLDSLGKLIDQA